MATLRKGNCYRKITRPYTRKSKFKKKGFIKAVPTSKVTHFDMGDTKKSFPFKAELITVSDVQIRHNAMESARQVVNRHLHRKLGANYSLKLNLYPHHVLRENKMLVGAHADRLQTGMAHSFGRAIGLAAQVKKGKTIFSAFIEKTGIETAKEALSKARCRLPCKCVIEISEVK